MKDRFLADEMLAKLVRFMMMVGIPVDYISGVDDDEILVLARRKKYTLLTRDEELCRRCLKRGIPVFLITDVEVEKQLAAVVSGFALKLPPFPSGTLCPKCGSQLVRVEKETLKGKVYPRVLAKRKLFWKCGRCGRIYWSGTHYERIARMYRKIKKMTAAR